MLFTSKINEKARLKVEFGVNNQVFVELNGEILDYHNTRELIQEAINNNTITLEEGKEIETNFKEMQKKMDILNLAEKINYSKLEELVYSE
jgi:hypothetical protein